MKTSETFTVEGFSWDRFWPTTLLIKKVKRMPWRSVDEEGFVINVETSETFCRVDKAGAHGAWSFLDTHTQRRSEVIPHHIVRDHDALIRGALEFIQACREEK